jgi:hypothetical protein
VLRPPATPFDFDAAVLDHANEQIARRRVTQKLLVAVPKMP